MYDMIINDTVGLFHHVGIHKAVIDLLWGKSRDNPSIDRQTSGKRTEKRPQRLKLISWAGIFSYIKPLKPPSENLFVQ